MSKEKPGSKDVNKIVDPLLLEIETRTFTREELHKILTFCDKSLSSDVPSKNKVHELARAAVMQLEGYAFPSGLVGFIVRNVRRAIKSSAGATVQEALWTCKYSSYGSTHAGAEGILLSRQSKDDLLLLISRDATRKQEAGQLLLDRFGSELSFEQYLLLLRQSVCLQKVDLLLKNMEGLTTQQILQIAMACRLNRLEKSYGQWWGERWLKECPNPSVTDIDRIARLLPELREKSFERLLDGSPSPINLVGVAMRTSNPQTKDRSMRTLLEVLTPAMLARYSAGCIDQWKESFNLDNDRHLRISLCELVHLDAYRADLLVLLEGIRLCGAEYFVIYSALPHDHPKRIQFAEAVWQHVLRGQSGVDLINAIMRNADNDLALKIARHVMGSPGSLKTEQHVALTRFPELSNMSSALDLIPEPGDEPTEPKKNPPDADARIRRENDGIQP